MKKCSVFLFAVFVAVSLVCLSVVSWSAPSQKELDSLKSISKMSINKSKVSIQAKVVAPPNVNPPIFRVKVSFRPLSGSSSGSSNGPIFTGIKTNQVAGNAALMKPMSKDQSNAIADKLDALSSSMATASEYWYKSFTTTQYQGWMKTYNGVYGLALAAFAVQAINFDIPPVDPQANGQGVTYNYFQNVKSNLASAKSQALDAINLLNSFDYMPKTTAGEKENWISYLNGNIGWIDFYSGRCDWLFQIAPTLPEFDYTAWIFIPGTDPGPDMMAASAAYKVVVDYFRNYYPNHNL